MHPKIRKKESFSLRLRLKKNSLKTGTSLLLIAILVFGFSSPVKAISIDEIKSFAQNTTNSSVEVLKNTTANVASGAQGFFNSSVSAISSFCSSSLNYLSAITEKTKNVANSTTQGIKDLSVDSVYATRSIGSRVSDGASSVLIEMGESVNAMSQGVNSFGASLASYGYLIAKFPGVMAHSASYLVNGAESIGKSFVGAPHEFVKGANKAMNVFTEKFVYGANRFVGVIKSVPKKIAKTPKYLEEISSAIARVPSVIQSNAQNGAELAKNAIEKTKNSLTLIGKKVNALVQGDDSQFERKSYFVRSDSSVIPVSPSAIPAEEEISMDNKPISASIESGAVSVKHGDSTAFFGAEDFENSSVIASRHTDEATPSEAESTGDRDFSKLAQASFSENIKQVPQNLGEGAKAIGTGVKDVVDNFGESMTGLGDSILKSFGELFIEAPKTIVKLTKDALFSLKDITKDKSQDAKVAISDKKVLTEKDAASIAPKEAYKEDSASVEKLVKDKDVASSEKTDQIYKQIIEKEVVKETVVVEKASKQSSSVLDGLLVRGDADITGNTEIGGALLLDNNFIISSVFSIDSASGDVVALGDITTADGKISAKDLSAKGNIDFKDAVIDFTGAEIIGMAVNGGTVNNYYTNVISSGSAGSIGGSFQGLSVVSDATIGGAATITGTLTGGTASFTGNVTLGDGSGDSLTINAGTVSIPNNLTFSGGNVTFSGSSATSTFGGNLEIQGAGTSTLLYGLTVASSGGNVGIGTQTPGYTLDVAGDINFSGTLYDGGSPFVTGYWTQSGSDIYYLAGKAGIGTASPSSTFEVYATSTSPWFEIGDGNATTTIGGYSLTATSTNPYGMSIASSGGTLQLGAYVFPSTDGTSGQVLQTDGSGALTWEAQSGGGSNWSYDTNYTVDVITPSSTIPIWQKDAFYASSTIYVDGVLYPYGGISTSTLDDVAIGGSTASTGVFTSLQSTGVFTPTGGISTSTLDSVIIGGSTAAAGTFTDLTFTGTGSLGDNSSGITINSNTWDISSAGVASNLSISTSTLDDVAIGATTRSTGVFSSLLVGSSGGAATGTLTIYDSSDWLTVGNGVASTTIRGSGTSTFPYGLNLATTGGNVGIGVGVDPEYLLTIRPSGSITNGVMVTESDSNTNAIRMIGSTAGGELRVFNGGSLNHYILGAGSIVFNETGGGGSDFRIESDNNEYMFFVDAGNDAIGINNSTPSSTLEIYHATNDWLGIGNGSATTTIRGSGTSTFPYGLNLATSGGNVGIGISNPSQFITIRPRNVTDSFLFTESDSDTNRAFNIVAYTDGATVGFFGNNQTTHSINTRATDGTIVFNEQGLSTADIRFESDNNPYMFFLDASADVIEMADFGNSGHDVLRIGNGTATTTLSGGTSGSATTTFAGDVSIPDLYTGLTTFAQDGGMVEGMDIPVSANAATGTEQGYVFLVDGMQALRVLGSSDAQGLVWDPRIELVDSLGTATTTLRVKAGTTSTFANDLSLLSGNLSVEGVGTSTFVYGLNLATEGGNVGIGTSDPGAGLHIGSNTPGTITAKNGLFVSGGAEFDGVIYPDGGISTSTLDDVAIGATTRSTGVFSSLLVGSSGGAATGTLTIYDSSDWLTIGNGVASTTIRGSGTSTFPYGLNLATTGGNVGIGVGVDPEYLLTIKPSSVNDGLAVTESNSNDIGVLMRGNSASGDILAYYDGTANHVIAGNGTTRFNDIGLALDFRIESDNNPYMFFLDASADVIEMADFGNSGHDVLRIGNGSATTTLSGGTSGSATTTFAGDVSIPDLYIGQIEFPLDNGISEFTNAPVSSNGSGEQGYAMLVDGLPVLRILADSDGAGSVSNLRIELADNQGYATTTIKGNGATSTFAGPIAATGTITASCTGDCLDIAEQYHSIEEVEAGDVVISADSLLAVPTGVQSILVQKSSAGYANNVVGIVSTNPGLVLGENGGVKMGSGGSGTGYNPNIALAGRVPVKITNENGEIKRGDLLVTSASQPGYAMKLSDNAPAGAVSVFAMALEDWNPETEEIISEGEEQIKTNKLTVLIKTAIIYNGSGDFGEHLAVEESEDGEIEPGEAYYDFQGKALLGIASLESANGTWSLSEAGEFVAKSVKAKVITMNELVISMESETSDNGDILDPAIGNSYIKSDENTRVVYNNRVKENSQIFITFRDNTGGPWWISNQGDGFFEVSVPASMGYNIRFKYWIVGVEGEDDSSDEIVEGAPKSDILPPEISGVSAVNITEYSASINWNTNEPADSIVYVRVSSSTEPIVFASSDLTQNHSINLNNLLANTTYNYKVKSTDEAGNEIESLEYSFKTSDSTHKPSEPSEPSETPEPDSEPTIESEEENTDQSDSSAEQSSSEATPLDTEPSEPTSDPEPEPQPEPEPTPEPSTESTNNEEIEENNPQEDSTQETTE